jgi:putative ABC transport system ATP-binding protein/lipoprotein-releasing system ATP-binding protein
MNKEALDSPLYAIQSLEYGYQWGQQFVPVLRGVTLNIPQNSFVCLVGPSGSGKTTLLNLLGFLDRPQKGQLKFAGRDVTHLGENELTGLRLKDLGFVFQAFYLIPTLSVLENTIYFLNQLGLSRAAAVERGEDTLKKLGLIDHRYKRPGELSGGQRQRVAIARALAKRPKVILADEPTANLDRETSETIIGVFKDLQKTEGVSFVFSTHDHHLVSYAERTFTLRAGLIAEGETETGTQTGVQSGTQSGNPTRSGDV